MKRVFLSTVAALMLVGGIAVPAASGNESPQTVTLSPAQEALADLIKLGNVQGMPLRDPQGVLEAYQHRNFEPFWSKKGKVTGKAGAALDVLEDSWTHGMSPASYNVEVLRRMAKAKLDARQALDFEVLLSDAVAHYGHDMTGMRVSARAVGEDVRSWSKGLGTVQVLDFVMSGQNVERSLQRLEPASPLYEAMRNDLKKIIKDIVEHPEKDLPDLKYPGAIHPGESHPSIAEIRARLGLPKKSGDRNIYYDDDLVIAIAKFQQANGLKGDAIIGRRTFAALNQGRRSKLVKLIAGLERLRWLDPRMPQRYIVVNVPAMTLWGIENGEIKMEMPIIVGREKRPTYSFITSIIGIRFNPSWNVPNTIKTEDFLPELQKDPTALAKKGIELIRYTSDGVETIPPDSIDWTQMTPETIKAIGMVQNPGDANALGRIRVLMPNKYDIYLHDTNSPDLFKKDFRALSSGCIRLAEPSKVASFILGKNKGWTDEKIKMYLSKTKTVEVRAETELPVYILYQTVWLDDHGDLVYGEDIYRRDAKLVKELQRTGQVSLP
jgi:murein L,D-transpeptidase YcbB/YkuD